MIKTINLLALLTIIALFGACTKTPDPVVTAPVAAFGFPTTGFIAPADVAFSNATVGENVSYQWDFGDGGIASDKTPTHRYVTAGTYTVKLTAINSAGNNSATKSIVIAPVAGGFTKCSVSGITLLQFPASISYLYRPSYTVLDNSNNTLGTGYYSYGGSYVLDRSYLPHSINYLGGSSLFTPDIATSISIKINYQPNNSGPYVDKIISFKASDYAPTGGSPFSEASINTSDGWGVRIQLDWSN